MVCRRIPAACGRGGFTQNQTEINQTKQIGKYILMENILHHQGSNSHPEGMRRCFTLHICLLWPHFGFDILFVLSVLLFALREAFKI
jgi:hypothetical protein